MSRNCNSRNWSKNILKAYRALYLHSSALIFLVSPYDTFVFQQFVNQYVPYKEMNNELRKNAAVAKISS